jgi:hypothetical protein
MREKFEKHLFDELRRAHAGHGTQFLGGCPGIGGQREEPVSARPWPTHYVSARAYRGPVRVYCSPPNAEADADHRDQYLRGAGGHAEQEAVTSLEEIIEALKRPERAPEEAC